MSEELPDVVDVDGYVDDNGIQFFGKATRQPDGRYVALASVNDKLCSVECNITSLLDRDLDGMDRNALLAEVKRLRAGIRKHRDASGHDLCHWHPELWALLPSVEKRQLPVVPPWPEFMQRCAAYRATLDAAEVAKTKT